MRRPKPAERNSAANRSQASDKTMLDISRPAGTGSVGQQSAGSALQVSVATDVGRVRHNNEDYVQAERLVRDGRRYSMWAVADGVGGGPQGERASRAAVETVVDYLAHEPWTDPSVALTEAFALANRNVYDITGEGAAASTLVVALVSEPDGVVCIANVGDSRAYLVSAGQLQQVTDDHSIVAARVAAGQLTAEEARTAPNRNILTRSIGSETEVLVDVFGPRQLQPNELLVLCTDGVHGMIDDAEIARIASGWPIGQSAGALVAAAVEAGGKDNATALVGGYAQVGVKGRAAGAAIGARSGSKRGRSPKVAILAAGVVVLAIVAATLGVLAYNGGGRVASAPPSAKPTASGGKKPANTTAAANSPTKTASTTSAVDSGTFTKTGNLTAARSGATATLLGDGTVLIAGGSGDTPAELYSREAKRFDATGSMTLARTGATATLLQDGRVLIVGGSADDSAELYTPNTGEFTKTGKLTKVRTGATATLLDNGNVLIAGGSGDTSAELYSPKAKRFVATGSMTLARMGATATLLQDGRVLIVGGSADDSAELYTPNTGEFTKTGKLTVARSGATATLLDNGNVLIAGGDNDGTTLTSAEIYTP